MSFIKGMFKFLLGLAVLALVAYVVITYWDKIVDKASELKSKLDATLAGVLPATVEQDEMEDYYDI